MREASILLGTWYSFNTLKMSDPILSPSLPNINVQGTIWCQVEVYKGLLHFQYKAVLLVQITV